MMTPVTIVCLVLSCPMVYAYTEWCNNAYNNRLERAIDSALHEVQEAHVSEMEAEGPGPYPLGFDGYTVIGLGALRRHGDFRTVCENNTQVVSFDLLSEGPVLCLFRRTGGQNDTLAIAAHDVNVTTHLRFVTASTDENAETDSRILDQIDEPVVTTLRTGRVTVNTDGTSGDALNVTTGLLRHLALLSIQDSWEEQFVSKFVRVLRYT
ncbi:uncharacterized protein [Dermacentor andersoni]|uniref:uncharacterized protein n=1 Tax=Dermacentor andersoni TaxID=34620 RepID=UPI003B3B56F0